MKRVELEKHKAMKIVNKLSQSGGAGRPGEIAQTLSRREQRERDQAQGLVPFSTKLNGDLVNRLHALAQERRVSLGEVVTELLEKGLAA